MVEASKFDEESEHNHLAVPSLNIIFEPNADHACYRH